MDRNRTQLLSSIAKDRFCCAAWGEHRSFFGQPGRAVEPDAPQGAGLLPSSSRELV